VASFAANGHRLIGDDRTLSLKLCEMPLFIPAQEASRFSRLVCGGTVGQYLIHGTCSFSKKRLLLSVPEATPSKLFCFRRGRGAARDSSHADPASDILRALDCIRLASANCRAPGDGILGQLPGRAIQRREVTSAATRGIFDGIPWSQHGK
jgi:hypothetical protein